MHTIKMERYQFDFSKLISILIAIDLRGVSVGWFWWMVAVFIRVKTRILKHCMDKTTEYELRNDYV